MKKLRYLLSALISLVVLNLPAQEVSHEDTSALLWRNGYLDIHHINTGRGNSCFMIFPDGTTMLVDAGDIIDSVYKSQPLTVTRPYPNGSHTAAEWIVDYIDQVMPGGRPAMIDYALITHFHGDHFGVITNDSKTSKYGKYRLSGITEIAEWIPFGKMFDRNYPAYDFPTDLRRAYAGKNSSFLNYLSFTEARKTTMQTEALVPGSDRQIVLKNQSSFPSFKTMGVKANATVWTGSGKETQTLFTKDSILTAGNKFNENPLSMAVKISYGRFDYFTGGDNTGLHGYGLPNWFDVETPMGNAVGKVEVTTLNHHGNRDATNENFLRHLQPVAVVEQTWCSDHPGQEVMHRLISDHIYKGEKNIFATNIQEVTKQTLGFWFTRGYKSMFGHVIVRVLPGGEKFLILIAETVNGKITVKRSFGPYQSR